MKTDSQLWPDPCSQSQGEHPPGLWTPTMCRSTLGQHLLGTRYTLPAWQSSCWDLVLRTASGDVPRLGGRLGSPSQLGMTKLMWLYVAAEMRYAYFGDGWWLDPSLNASWPWFIISGLSTGFMVQSSEWLSIVDNNHLMSVLPWLCTPPLPVEPQRAGHFECGQGLGECMVTLLVEVVKMVELSSW